MAINRVTYPSTPTPASGDWDLIVDLMQTAYLKLEGALRIDYDNDNVLEGSVFHIGGSVFLADSDTAISGTPSDYVKLTVSGSTASAAYVANLTGVTWNDAQNGYYDVGGNLYVFDESRALLKSVITSTKTIEETNVVGYFYKGYMSLDLSNYASTSAPEIVSGSVVEINGVTYKNESNVTITGSVSNSTWYDILLTPSGNTFAASYVARGTGTWSASKGGLYSGNNRVIGCLYVDGSGNYINKNIFDIRNRKITISIELGDWNMFSVTSFITVPHGVTLSAVRDISVKIRNDSGSDLYPLEQKLQGNENSGEFQLNAANLVCTRVLNRGFYNTDFDSTGYNRGWGLITYEV